MTSRAPENETKAEKFIRLADFRTNKVIEYLNSLSNLSNKSVYEYTPEQVTAIIQAIDDQLNKTQEALTAVEVKAPAFTLKAADAAKAVDVANAA